MRFRKWEDDEECVLIAAKLLSHSILRSKIIFPNAVWAII